MTLWSEVSVEPPKEQLQGVCRVSGPEGRRQERQVELHRDETLARGSPGESSGTALDQRRAEYRDYSGSHSISGSKLDLDTSLSQRLACERRLAFRSKLQIRLWSL